MKRLLKVLSFLPVLLVLGSCEFVLGPDTPAGEGNLSVSVGANGRAISSGADLPSSLLDVLRYELVLTGPNGETLNPVIGGGETLKLTVSLGQWRIDARAYQEDGLAGTGSVLFTVSSGFNSVRVPMMINGGYFSITPSPMSGGAVTASFDAAFPDTTITLTPLPDEGYALGTLKYNDGTDHVISGPPYTFTMPESDVTVSAEFVNLIRYVTETGSGDGLSWANASGDLQAMMDELAELYDSGLYPGPFVVKAAAGTYRPQYKPNADGTTDLTTPANDRDSAFILRKGVQVWGGYPASGGEDSSRNITAHETILSGDIDGDGTLNGNAYHVVLGINIPVAAGTVLDGLTISGGNASGTGSIMANGYSVLQKNGGGMYNAGSSPVLTNVIISGNTVNDKGGGMYNDSSSPILANATISGNTVGGSDGGGMYNYHSSPVLVNVIISGNSVIWGGGGMFNGDDSNTAATLLSRPVLINVAIFGNTSSVGNGGGMYNWNAAPILTNVTISGNSANNAIHNRQTSSLQVRNSIIWGNKAGSKAIYYDSWASSSAPIPVITYSNVEGSGGSDSWDSSIKSDGGNNRDVNPSFADWQDPGSVIMPNSEGDYGLAAGSPAIDAGGNALYPDTWEKWQSLIGVTGAITTKAEYDAYIAPHLGKDLAGNARIQGTAIDMGACEKQ